MVDGSSILIFSDSTGRHCTAMENPVRYDLNPYLYSSTTLPQDVDHDARTDTPYFDQMKRFLRSGGAHDGDGRRCVATDSHRLRNG